jgi:hypothetical protein
MSTAKDPVPWNFEEDAAKQVSRLSSLDDLLLVKNGPLTVNFVDPLTGSTTKKG